MMEKKPRKMNTVSVELYESDLANYCLTRLN